jgi:UDP-N-acetylglucosamine:LPS N-acetylglucosamine transferase
VQLNRVIPAFEGYEIAFATVNATYREDVAPHRFYAVRDATRWSPFSLVVVTLQLLWVLVRERPDVIVSTGAAPGVAAIFLGRLIRARTIWLDSIANIEQLSMSGQMVRRYADLWLTQWPHLADDGGPEYAGQVL